MHVHPAMAEFKRKTQSHAYTTHDLRIESLHDLHGRVKRAFVERLDQLIWKFISVHDGPKLGNGAVHQMAPV